MILYIVSTTAIVAVILFAFIVFGIIPAGMSIYSVILATGIPVIMNYYQSWKLLKEN